MIVSFMPKFMFQILSWNIGECITNKIKQMTRNDLKCIKMRNEVKFGFSMPKKTRNDIKHDYIGEKLCDLYLSPWLLIKIQNKVKIWFQHAHEPQKLHITKLYWVKILWPPFQAMASNDLQCIKCKMKSRFEFSMAKNPITNISHDYIDKNCVTSIRGHGC